MNNRYYRQLFIIAKSLSIYTIIVLFDGKMQKADIKYQNHVTMVE